MQQQEQQECSSRRRNRCEGQGGLDGGGGVRGVRKRTAQQQRVSSCSRWMIHWRVTVVAVAIAAVVASVQQPTSSFFFVSANSPYGNNAGAASSTSPSSSSSTGAAHPQQHSIPRSHNNHHYNRRARQQQQSSSSCSEPRAAAARTGLGSLLSDPLPPPWNPSPLIDDAGFLSPLYYRIPGEWEQLEWQQEYQHYKHYLEKKKQHHQLLKQRQKRRKQLLQSSSKLSSLSARVRVLGGILLRSSSTSSSSTSNILSEVGGASRGGGGSEQYADTEEDEDEEEDELESLVLQKLYPYKQLCTVPVHIRQVPGDGNCLFHSISLCLAKAVNGTHWNLTTTEALEELYEHSCWLRQQAVDCLRGGGSGSSKYSSSSSSSTLNPNKRLYLQGRESLLARELVLAAAQQYGLTPAEYCAAMEQESVWGGGPEIVALSNCLQRPIHVYELAVADVVPGGQQPPAWGDQAVGILPPSSDDDNNNNPADNDSSGSPIAASFYHHYPLHPNARRTFVLRRMACFGSPKFDKLGREPLHILSADSRFPDLQPGHQLAAGNHFLAVFPQEKQELSGVQKKKKNGSETNDNLSEQEEKEREERRRRRRLLNKRKRLRGGGEEVDDEEDDNYDEEEDSSFPPQRWMMGWLRRTVLQHRCGEYYDVDDTDFDVLDGEEED